VQAFVREPEERERYNARLGSILDIALLNARVWSTFESMIGFLAFSAVTLVVWYGGSLVIRNELTAGQLTSFFFYTLAVAGGIGAVGGLYGGLRAAAGATARVRELLETTPTVADRPDATVLPKSVGRITFDNVRFAYPTKPDRAAIDGVNIDVARGEMIALVGPSGGGKSTLVALLLRFHDPQEGTVSIEGIDVRCFRLADLRDTIGLVSQDIFLFGGTVTENIRYGNPAADEESVRAAARAARAHDFVAALPRGYDTEIGERGIQLSTGERQRIAIARVLLKDSAIVVLDEATSSLDAESEREVQLAFQQLCKGRTTLVIAHRLSTVRRADRVVFLDQGRVVEQGTHDELFQRAGAYRRLCELQMIVD
jgi:ABC-type multidrug transport system fused ATPase/permease subunit